MSKMIFEPLVRSAQTMHLCCTDTNIISKSTEMTFHMSHSPRSYIGCVQNDFRTYGMFGANHALIFHQG